MDINIGYVTAIIWLIVLVIVLIKANNEQRTFKIAIPAFFFIGAMLYIFEFKTLGVSLELIGFLLLCYMVYTYKKWTNK